MTELMTIDEVADLFKVSTRTIQDWRKTITFPKPIDLPGRTLRWRRDHMAAYLEDMTEGI